MSGTTKGKAHPLRRRLPILLIGAVALIGAVTLRDQLTFAALAQHREALLAYRDAHYLLSVLLFMVAYTVMVAFSLPGATVATLTGGFLFGLFPGVLFNVLSATTGAIGIFLAARMGFGAELSARIAAGGGAAARLQAGLRRNEMSVLFLMRILPLVPFFLANLIPAAMNVALWRFALTTFFGIMPGALLLTSIGSGMGEVLERGEVPDLSLLGDPRFYGPMLGLALLAALPIILRAVRRKEPLE